MSLIKRSDWPSLINGSWLSDFFDNDRFFDSDLMRKQSMPAVNVNETKNGFEIELAAPGFEKKDFKITVDNGVLTIASERKDEKEEKEKNYTRREFSYQSFSRSFSLPENVNQDDVKANYQDGILKLQLTKKEMSVSKEKKAIEVR
jgi:HSP20 family protein